jgi:branched-chain amino acid transport system ATP-binding protein
MAEAAELDVEDVTVRYGGAEAVSSASITAARGTITALVGPNGAGKSSLLNALIGAVPATAKRIAVRERPIERLDTTSRVAAGLVLVPQGRQIFPHLTVRENLQVIADGLRLPQQTVADALDRFPILAERRRLPAGILSGGEQQMLALARALMTSPKVLLLDEPTLGLAPIIVAEIVRTIAALAASGIAIVIAEPSMRLIRGRIDHGYVMLRGRIVAEAHDADGLEREYLRLMGMEHKAPLERERPNGKGQGWTSG